MNEPDFPACHFIVLEDGKVYYWPKTENGAMSAEQLRKIAEELDKMNVDPTHR